MWPIVIDGVMWSVCLSVGLSRLSAVQKQSRCHLRCRLRWAQGTINYTVVQIPTCEEAIFRAKRGQPTTCPVVDVPKATQQGAALVRCGCRFGCTRWGCTLAQPGKNNWTVRVRWYCGSMSNYLDHLLTRGPLTVIFGLLVHFDILFVMFKGQVHVSECKVIVVKNVAKVVGATFLTYYYYGRPME